MEQIIQLKTMRDAALARLQANPDFKLVNSLGALISDLEAVIAAPLDEDAPVEVAEAETDDAPIVEAEENVVALDEASGEASDEAADEIEEAFEIAAETDADEEADISIEALEAELNSSEETPASSST